LSHRPHDGLSLLDLRRRRLATGFGLLVGSTAYLLTLFDFSFRPGRTANALGYASGFFDIQARAFLDGDLAVPRGSLGIEGFIQDGQEYTYFGPWPAFLRMPVLLLTTEYDGQLTIASMLLAFVVLAVMGTKLAWLVRNLMQPGVPVSRFEAVSMAVLLVLITAGTTLTAVAALPWVYHEVYAWAVSFAVGAMYWMLRVLREPSRHSILWLLAFGLGAILTRTTGGWAVALATIGIGVWVLLRRHELPQRRELGLGAIGAGVLVLLIGVAFNWVKFRHPYLFPLEDQVWTQLNAHRREALDVNGGTITGPQFFPTAFMAYFRIDGVRFVDHFPFITLPAEPAQSYAGAFVDQSYRTGSVTAFMPWLLAMTVLAALVLFRPGVDQARRWLRVPLVAGVLITGGVMAYGYFAHRYTAEFVPALVMGGIVGTVALTSWLQRRPRWVARTGLALAAAATAYSVAASMLVGHTAAAYTAGGPRLVDFLGAQHRITPDAQAELVTFSEDLPSGGSTDELWIRGDCDALYLNSGDRYDEWLLVERRSLVVVATLEQDFRAGRVQMMRVLTDKPRSVWLQTSRRGQARVQLVNESGTYSGPWFDVPAPYQARVGIRDLAELGYAEVSSNPGGYVGLVRTFEWGQDWVSSPVEIVATEPDPRELEAVGLRLRTDRGLTPSLCGEIRDATRER